VAMEGCWGEKIIETDKLVGEVSVGVTEKKQK